MKYFHLDRDITADIQLEILAGQCSIRAISAMYDVSIDTVEDLVEQIFDDQLQFLTTETGSESSTVL